MARLSSTPLDKTTYRQILDTLDLVLGKLKKEEVRMFLFSLLGKNERIMVAKRFMAIILLKQGYTMTDIAKGLKLTIGTVRRLNMTMQIKNEGFDLAFKKMSREKIKKEINTILLGLAKTSAEIFFTHRVKPPNDYPR